MKTVSISRLKASLSAYLEHVSAGEEVLVTDRGRPVARIVPPSRADGWDGHLDNLVRRGLARPGQGKLPAGFWTRNRVKDPAATARKALSEEREEGR